MFGNYVLYRGNYLLGTTISVISEMLPRTTRPTSGIWIAKTTSRNCSVLSSKVEVTRLLNSAFKTTLGRYEVSNVILRHEIASALKFSTNSACMKTFKNDGPTRRGSDKDASVLNREKRIPKKYQEDGSPLILLIETKDKTITITLRQAERLAKRRDLKIVQVEDPTLIGNTTKQVFKLITGKEYYEVTRAQKEEKSITRIKGEKTISINGKIAENDLASKLQNIEKWVKKGFQVKATIASRGSSQEDMEKIFGKIEEAVTKINGRVIQRREKFGDIKFFIGPPKEDKKKAKKADEETSDVSQTTDNEKPI